MPHSVRKLLLDVSISCEEILEFTRGKNFEDFQKNRMLQLAIERKFEIIGEAFSDLKKLTETIWKIKFRIFEKSLVLEM